MMDNNCPIANPLVVLREEFDDWAVLFSPETGEGFGLNPVCVFIWKRLDGNHTTKSIQAEMRQACENMPDDAMEKMETFIQDLVERGLAGYELQGV